jgi:uncharacterized protein
MLSELSANVVAFSRLLRANGLPVGPIEEADALRAMDYIRIGDPEEFRLALRTILTSSHKEQEFFDRLYPQYWNGPMESASLQGEEDIDLLKKKKAPEKEHAGDRSILNWAPLSEAEEEEPSAGYSPQEVLTKKDLSKFQEEDYSQAIRIVRKMARLLSIRLSRRYRKSSRHQEVDFRKTMRLSLRNAGEMLEIAFRERSLRQMKLIVLCDVSGSMEKYSRFLITFIYALQQAYGPVETFAFSTSLHRLTGILKRQNIREILDGISEAVPDWSGGTKIGNSLQDFIENYGALLNKDTIVLILSDGWDVGEVELMESRMKEIHQKTGRVIWLNPLLGSPDYQPDCLGMKAALPYVDDFLPAHNLDSLQNLCNHIASIRRRRGLRLVS